MFNLVKDEGGNKVDINTLREIAEKFHIEINEKELEDMIEAADLNFDKNVNKEEFREMLKRTKYI